MSLLYASIFNEPLIYIYIYIKSGLVEFSSFDLFQFVFKKTKKNKSSQLFVNFLIKIIQKALRLRLESIKLSINVRSPKRRRSRRNNRERPNLDDGSLLSWPWQKRTVLVTVIRSVAFIVFLYAPFQSVLLAAFYSLLFLYVPRNSSRRERLGYIAVTDFVWLCIFWIQWIKWNPGNHIVLFLLCPSNRFYPPLLFI